MLNIALFGFCILLLMLCVQGSSTELPKNGPFWHEIREVALPDILYVTTEFNSLLKVSYLRTL